MLDKVTEILVNVGMLVGLVILGILVFLLLVTGVWLIWSKMIEPSLDRLRAEYEAKQHYKSEISNPETARHYSKTNVSSKSVKPTDRKVKKRRLKMKREKKSFYDNTNQPFTTVPMYVYCLMIICILICVVVSVKDGPTQDANATESSIVEPMIPSETPVPTDYIEVDMFEEIFVSPCDYTEEELEYCKWIVEAEAHDLSKHHKTLIMCVLVNRLKSDLWNYDSLTDVIFDKNQFPSTYNIYERKLQPNEDTIAAVESVLSGEIDPEKYAQGALFFYNPDRCGGKISFFEKRHYLFSLDGHRFFA